MAEREIRAVGSSMDNSKAEQSLKREVLMLMVMSFAFPTFLGLAVTLGPLLMADMGLSKPVIGLLQAVPGLLVVMLGAPLAQMANTRWRRGTLIGTFVLAGLASLLYGQARTGADLILPQLLMGLATPCFFGNMLATSFRLAAGPMQSGIQGKITAFQGLGYFIGPLLGGYLSKGGYGWGFSPGLLCALVGLLAAARLSPAVDIETYRGFRDFLGSAYARYFRVLTHRRAVWVGRAFVSLNSFQLYVTGGTFFLVYASVIGLSTLQAAWLMSSRELVSAVVRLGFGALSRRVSPVVQLGMAVILGALVLSALPFTTTFWGLGLIALVLGIAGAVVPPALNMLAGASASPEEQSFAILCLASGHFLVQTLMAPVIGLALSMFDYEVTYPLVGLVWIGLALLALKLGLRVVRRQEAEALENVA